MRKVDMGSKNLVELEERAGLDLNQRHRGLQWMSCQRSCSPNFRLVQEFPAGYLLLGFF